MPALREGQDRSSDRWCAGKFPSTVRAYDSDFVVRGERGGARAVGFMDVRLPEDQKRSAWDWLVPQVQMGNMEWLEKNGSPHNGFPELRCSSSLSQSGAEKVFAGSPRSLGNFSMRLGPAEPQSLALAVNVRLHEVSSHTSADSPNVIGEVQVRPGATQSVCRLHGTCRSSGDLPAGERR